MYLKSDAKQMLAKATQNIKNKSIYMDLEDGNQLILMDVGKVVNQDLRRFRIFFKHSPTQMMDLDIEQRGVRIQVVPIALYHENADTYGLIYTEVNLALQDKVTSSKIVRFRVNPLENEPIRILSTTLWAGTG